MYRQQELTELLFRSFSCMLERIEKNLASYPFIDTKFNIRTGKNFSAQDEYFRQRDHIYGWIQGRGLESIAGHAAFFEKRGEHDLAERCDAVLATLVKSLEDMRLKMGGKLFFAFSPQGKILFDTATSYSNYTDLFYAKGLFAAAERLRQTELAKEAKAKLQEIGSDIFERRFSSDQYMFDPANRGGAKPGKFSQGPLMIYLGATALAGDFTTAEKFISFIINKHINHGQFPQLSSGCFVEALNANDQPYLEDDGKIICDPGHALEFTGLAARNLLAMSKTPQYADFAARSAKVLAALFIKVFDTGFQSAGGVMKAYDLAAQTPVNTDAPWWSLPEAMRGAALLKTLCPAAADELDKRTQLLADAFFDNYISNGSYGFACQMCDVNGDPADVIPAVPDADPLYHTNLPLIDIFELQKP